MNRFGLSYNDFTNTVRCNKCGTTTPVKARSRGTAIIEVEAMDWCYSELALFACPTCAKKKGK